MCIAFLLLPNELSQTWWLPAPVHDLTVSVDQESGHSGNKFPTQGLTGWNQSVSGLRSHLRLAVLFRVHVAVGRVQSVASVSSKSLLSCFLSGRDHAQLTEPHSQILAQESSLRLSIMCLLSSRPTEECLLLTWSGQAPLRYLSFD